MGVKFLMCMLLIILGITTVFAAEEVEEMAPRGVYAAEKDRRQRIGKKRVANQN